MDECVGEWESTITWKRRHGKEPPNPPVDPDDGDIHIEHDHTKNKHKARNGKEHPLENFSCTPDPQDPKKFTISFERKEPLPPPGSGEETILYRGDGEILNASGDARIKGRARVPGGPAGGDNGTWESTREGGGEFEDKPQKGGRKDEGGDDARKSY